MKRAIIYYSLSNNTKEAAESLAAELGADLFRIELAKPMPDNFKKQILVGGMQSSFGLTPAIKEIPADFKQYDEIILGTPVWAGKAASPVNTLLKKYSIADKIIAVFTCSGGGDNEKCIQALTKKLKHLKYNVALADRSHKLSTENDEKIKSFAKGLL